MKQTYFSRLKTLVIGCTLLVFSSSIPVQAGGTETSINAEIGGKLFVKQFSWDFAEEWRLHTDLSTERFSHALSLGYKPIKYLKIHATYNLINNRDIKKGWENRHRWQLGGTASYGTKRWELSWRSIAQGTKRHGVSDYYQPEIIAPDGTILQKEKARSNPKWYWRNRVKYSYDIKNCHFAPYVSVECFYLTNDYIKNEVDKWRFIIGTQYNINKRQKLDFFLRYTTNEDEDDESPYMIGFGYQYTIPFKK